MIPNYDKLNTFDKQRALDALKEGNECVICNKPTGFNPKTKMFRKTCSPQCAGKLFRDNYGKGSKGHKDYIERRIVTNRLKYGTDHGFQNEEVIEKRKNTMISKYGVEYAMHSEELKNKCFDSFQNARKEEMGDNYSKLNCPEWMFNNYFTMSRNSTSIAEELGVHYSTVLDKLRSMGYDITEKTISQGEKEVAEYVKSIVPCVQSDRTIISPKELDVFIPSCNLAIEYNGLPWHSTKYHPENYHKDKTLKCLEKGIRLIHIFEHEWAEKNDICKSIISNAVGNSIAVNARDLTIGEIDADRAREFFNATHIAGHIPAAHYVALMKDDDIMLCVSFSGSRYDTSLSWEMIRMSSRLHTRVIGGASKAIGYFKRKYGGRIITYSDRRFGEGNTYESIGFDRVSETKVGYFYWKDGKTFSRIKFQKHKLSKLLENYDPSKTEKQNMENNGFYRVYDCGHWKFVLE